MSLPRAAAARALAAVRRGRRILWTPDFMQLGNLLSLARTVHDSRRAGHELWLLRTDALAPWLHVFPDLAPLTVERSDVRFLDQRLMPWSGPERLEQTPFDVTDTFDFIESRLLAAPVFDRIPSEPNTLVVNVRRGDYFTVREHLVEFGFDTRSYVRTAITRAVDVGGPPERITVVSDDPEWCGQNLGWLQDVAPVSFGDEGRNPTNDFVRVSTARRLVLSNSTFSFWGGFVSNCIHRDNFPDIVAPRFFSRGENGGYNSGLDSRWTIVEDIPGGWDSILQTGVQP